jgi:hypothetical protein
MAGSATAAGTSTARADCAASTIEAPDMCRGYPFYGGDPTPDAYMSQRCSFQADFRKQLPIVEVR